MPPEFQELEQLLTTLQEPERSQYQAFSIGLPLPKLRRFLRAPKEEQVFKVFIASLPPAERAEFEKLGASKWEDDDLDDVPDSEKVLEVVQVAGPDHRAVRRLAEALEERFGFAPSEAEEIVEFQLLEMLQLAEKNMSTTIQETVNQRLDEWVIEGMEETEKGSWLHGKFLSRGLDKLNKWASITELANAHGQGKATPSNRKRREDKKAGGRNQSLAFGRPPQDCEKYAKAQRENHHSRRTFVPRN